MMSDSKAKAHKNTIHLKTAHKDIADAYAKGLITDGDLSVFEKRKAAESIVDVLILDAIISGKKNSLVSNENREAWVRKLMDHPEQTSQLFLSQKIKS